MKRLTLNSIEICFRILKAKAKALFKNSYLIATTKDELLCFMFKDAEGDWITIRNDAELYDAIFEQQSIQSK